MSANHDQRNRYGLGAILVAAVSVGSLSLLPNALSAQAQDESELRVSEVCLDCHDDYAANLRGTPHRLPDDPANPLARLFCSDCHAGDARHYEDDPEAFPRVVPAALDPMDEARVCAQCHTNSHQQSMMEGNAHTMNEVNCSSCHQVHGNHRNALLQKKNQTTLCLDCHTSVAGEFARSYRHPVNDGIVTCTECHSTLAVTATEDLSMHGTNAACFQCHGEFQGPFPFEHQATVDYSTEGGGCITCHEPHGSHNVRMLNQPYEPPHYQLCSQCHSVPRHINNTMHGTTFAGVPCSDCHTDIHGSYVSRNFLSESLQPQGCFNVGCHQF